MQRLAPRRPWARSCAALVLGAALAFAAPPQTAPLIPLRVRPHVGDTLRTRYERDITMTGITKVHGRDTTLVTTTSTLILARLVVQTSDAAGCTLLGITDSVAVLSVGSQALAPGETVRRAMQGRRILLRVAPDGSSEMMNAPSDLDPEVGSFVQALPSVLPKIPVAPGGNWESALAVPVSGESGAGRGARLRVRYRFDSLGAGGTEAFVSLRGRMTRDSADGPVRGGARLASDGEITGALALDRTRGWWKESRVTITLKSVITPAPGNDAPPVRVETRITQRLRTEPAAPPAAPPR